MITLAIDSSEARGSVAVCKGGALASLLLHETPEDYSSWLLPAVQKGLADASSDLKSVDLFSVVTGPGSFTGLRVGITAVKAWSELLGKPVVGVSRLEVMARTMAFRDGFVAASFDAQRGQIFAGLYRANGEGSLSLVEHEMVIAADDFVRWVSERVGEMQTRWVTLDPELLLNAPSWDQRTQRGESPTACGLGLAAGVAQLAEECARHGELSDALRLDANYVRRSDAEIFWKDPASDGR